MAQALNSVGHAVAEPPVPSTDVEHTEAAPVEQAPGPVEEVQLVHRVEQVTRDARPPGPLARPAAERPVLPERRHQVSVVEVLDVSEVGVELRAQVAEA